MMKKWISLVSVLVVFSSVPSFSAIRVVWDLTHLNNRSSSVYNPANYLTGYYWELNKHLSNHTISIETTSAGFSSATLAGCDVAVICAPSVDKSVYTAAESATLQQYVSSGGALLIMADASGNRSYYSSILQDFGASLEAGNLGYESLVVFDLASNPVFDGVGQLTLFYAAALNTDSNYTTLAKTQNGKTVAAARKYGQGRVMVLADSTLWTANPNDNPTYFSRPDNSQFAVNVFENLADPAFLPEPASCLMLAAGSILLRLKNRPTHCA